MIEFRFFKTLVCYLFILLFMMVSMLSNCSKRSPEDKAKDEKAVEDARMAQSASIDEYLERKKDERKNQELDKGNMGGLVFAARLADKTFKYWNFRLYREGKDVLGQTDSTEGDKFIKLEPGVYDLKLEHTDLLYPAIKGISIEKGYITRVTLNLPCRIVLIAEKENRSVRIYNGITDEDIGMSSHDVDAGGKISFDLLPGKYKIVYAYTDKKMDDIIFEIKEGETKEIKL
jgi:hypothetical protein